MSLSATMETASAVKGPQYLNVKGPQYLISPSAPASDTNCAARAARAGHPVLLLSATRAGTTGVWTVVKGACAGVQQALLHVVLPVRGESRSAPTLKAMTGSIVGHNVRHVMALPKSDSSDPQGLSWICTFRRRA